MGTVEAWIPNQFFTDITEEYRADRIRVIFLDVDGVLNCSSTTEVVCGFTGVGDKKIRVLKDIVVQSSEIADTKIVLSSMWRTGVNRTGIRSPKMYDYLSDRLNEHGLSIFGTTPFIRSREKSRGEEIASWLISHIELNVSGYLILDDELFPDFNSYGLRAHLLKTSWDGDDGGLQEKHIQMALDILKIPVSSGRKES